MALGRRGAVVPDRDGEEVEHQVRVGDVLVAAREAAALEVVGGAEAAAVDQPLVGDAGPGPPAQAGRDRDRLLRGVLDVDLEVVLEVLADAGRVVDDVDAEAGEELLVADAGELEQLRRVDRAAAEDHLAGVDRATEPAAAQVVDPDRTLAVEAHPGGHRQGLDLEVGAAADRVQVGPGRGEPAAAVQVAVEPGEPLLPVAVDVVGERVAGLLDRREERREERVRRPGRAPARAVRRRRASRRRRRCRPRGGGSPSA